MEYSSWKREICGFTLNGSLAFSFIVVDCSLPRSLKHVVSNAEYYGPSIYLPGMGFPLGKCDCIVHIFYSFGIGVLSCLIMLVVELVCHTITP